MEGTDKRRTAAVVYAIYCIYGIFTWRIGGSLHWSQMGKGFFLIGMAGGAFLTFRKNFKAEIQAYFITLSSTLNILIFSIDTKEFAEIFTVICALACLLSFYHIPQINYFHFVSTTVFILYKFFAEGHLGKIIRESDYLVILRIACVYLVEIAMLILVKWHLESLKISREKTEEAQRACQAKADFLANMSHEIRTPMNVINGMTELVMQKELTGEEKEYVYGIHTAGESLLAIINDILDFSKLESGELELAEAPYETMSLFYDISSIAKIQIGEKKIELLVDVNPNLPLKLMGDVVRLKQIILNLVNNAVKYTEQGRISLRVDSVRKEYGVDMTVSVKDSGIGIRKEDVERIFHAFEQGDAKRSRAVEGTGLGLAISKEILSLMGGELQFESVFGEGSDFYFTIPQKIVDEKPCAAVKEKDKIYLGIYAEDGNSRERIANIADQLGLVYKVILDKDSVIATIQEEKMNHLLLDCRLGSGFPEFLRRLPEGMNVLVFEDTGQNGCDRVNLYVLERPVYSIVLASALNHRESGRQLYETEIKANRTRFRAPKASVLIVDDNAVNLKVAQGLLKSYEMQLDTAFSGSEAIEKVAENQYDLVLMDHMMPEMDGVEATQIIRRMEGEYYKKLPIIALSANAVHGAQKMFLEAGMDDFVAKPIEMRILAEKLLKWLPDGKIVTRREGVGADRELPGEETDWKQEPKPKQEAKPGAEEESGEVPVTGYAKFPEIEGMDYGTGLNYVGGDIQLYRDIVSDYAHTVEERATEIEVSLAAGDGENYTLNVHALKSVSRTIGALEIGKMAADLEESGKAGDWETIREKTPVMLERYRELGVKLMGQTEERAEDLPEITEEVLAANLQKLIRCLEEYDSMGAEESLADMGRYYYPEDAMWELFKKMKAEMDKFNYDACAEAANEMYGYLEDKMQLKI